jgi:hypothetical protein
MIDEDDDEIHRRLSNGGRTHFEMDEAFCGRMRAAIEAGLEKAPIGAVTTPGTKNPKYVPAEPFPLLGFQTTPISLVEYSPVSIGRPASAFGCSAIISPSRRSARRYAIGTAGLLALHLCRLFQA